jgi:hypothetical protein
MEVGGDVVDPVVDNKPDADLWRPRPADIEGCQWLRIASAGQVMLAARSPGVLAAVVGGTVFAYAFTWKPRKPSAKDPAPDREADSSDPQPLR